MRQRKGISYIWPKEYEEWPNGLLSGNGELGIIVFGNPLDETVIFNHRRFNIAATHERSFFKVSKTDLEEIRKACVQGDFKRANDLADKTHGWQDGGEGNRHPGYKLKIQIEKSGEVKDYFRECDFRTGVIDVGWEDDRGKWLRSVFVSRKDNIVAQRLTKPDHGKLDCFLSVDYDPGMHFPKGMEFWSEIKKDSLCFRAIYPEPEKTGKAGYEGLTRVILKGDHAKAAVENGGLKITDTSEVLLLTGIERCDRDCVKTWEEGKLYERLSHIQADYALLLQRHFKLHGSVYDRVTLDLEGAKEDRTKSNEALLTKQKESKLPVPALLERLFDAGRYHYLCSAGERAVPDLLGIWNGDCNVGWNGYYHLDANLNLQISGAIVGNMSELMEGYFWLNEVWKEDFRINAQKLLGCRGLLACGNSPGPTSGLISALNYAYPYHYVTGEEAWMLYPFWEYYQVTGDLEFLRDRLYPLLYELGLFYEDFLAEKDADGKYIFAGSISPENQPEGLGLSLVNNSAFDIAGARFALTTLIKVCELLSVEMGANEGAERWKKILKELPDYRINEDGALAEWAWDGLKDHYDHRHSSGLIGAFPYHEITPEADEALFEAARTALAKRDEYTYEDAGHGLLHAALIAAVLKNPDSLLKKLLRLMKEDFYYTGLGTAHYPEGKVFCTDVAHTFPTILMEMLVYSEKGVLELLPALPDCLKKGRIMGVLGRNRVRVEELSWDLEQKKINCILISSIDQQIDLIYRKKIAGIQTKTQKLYTEPGSKLQKIDLTAGKRLELEIEIVG